MTQHSKAAEKLSSGAFFLTFAGRRSELMGRDPRRIGGVGCGFASYSTLQTDSSRCGQKLGDANEIVGDSTKNHSTKPRPRYRVLRRPPTVFIQPKGSSIRLRLIVLMR